MKFFTCWRVNNTKNDAEKQDTSACFVAFPVKIHYNRTTFMKNLIVLVLGCLILSCSQQQQTTNVIPEDQFVNIYAEYLIFKERCAASNVDSTTFVFKADSLYKSHNVSSEQMTATIEYYSENPEEWKAMNQKVLQRLEAIQKERAGKVN